MQLDKCLQCSPSCAISSAERMTASRALSTAEGCSTPGTTRPASSRSVSRARVRSPACVMRVACCFETLCSAAACCADQNYTDSPRPLCVGLAASLSSVTNQASLVQKTAEMHCEVRSECSR